MAEIRIGTSGFGYDEWKGVFYPRGIGREEMLPFYARRFPVVEINTTYYGIPEPETAARWSNQVPPGFEFIVKANKEMTHGSGITPEARQAFADFRRAFLPVRKSGALAAVLAQFPQKFKPLPENELYLEFLKEELQDVPVVVEFRHRGWIRDETFERLRELGLGYCCVDEPGFKGLVPPVVKATSEIGYVRFHGRNYKKWYAHGDSSERYDYSYSPAELREWAPKIEALADQTAQTFVIYNNHKDGQSAINARQMGELLQQRLPEWNTAEPEQVKWETAGDEEAPVLKAA